MLVPYLPFAISTIVKFLQLFLIFHSNTNIHFILVFSRKTECFKSLTVLNYYVFNEGELNVKIINYIFVILGL